MRIAIDYGPALRQGAGIGRYTRGLVAALAGIDRDNFYTLFSAGRSVRTAAHARTWPANYQVRNIPLEARWLAIAWHRAHLPLPAEWLAGNCDLFHSPDFTLPPLRRARGVVTVHDLSFLRVPECADPGLRAFLARRVPLSARRANRVLADSDHTARDVNELLGVRPERIDVVPPGVDDSFSRVEDRDTLARARARYALPEHFILSVGTLEPRKNYVRLIAAFQRLREHTGLPHTLVIAGSRGWLYDGIYAEVDRRKLGDGVRFLGYVSDTDLPALYTLADLFVFPSLYEGFGIPPLESLACGTPVVCSDNSSLPQAVGDAALLVNAYDEEGMAHAMERLLSDDALRTRLLAAGEVQVSRYTWDAAARSLLASYVRAFGD